MKPTLLNRFMQNAQWYPPMMNAVLFQQAIFLQRFNRFLEYVYVHVFIA